jgi:hypothetical protein
MTKLNLGRGPGLAIFDNTPIMEYRVAGSTKHLTMYLFKNNFVFLWRFYA